MRQAWQPDGKSLNWTWRDKVPGSGIWGAVRMARNLLHHHWARAPTIVFEGGRHGWVWPSVDDLPPRHPSDEQNVPTYAELLAGESVSDTLHSLGAILADLERLLEPPQR